MTTQVHMLHRKKVKYKGQIFFIYTVGWFAYSVNRKATTVRRWEYIGVLPKPILTFPFPAKNWGKMRWYLAQEIIGYTTIYKQANVRRKVPIESTDFKQKAFMFKHHLQKLLNHQPEKLIMRLPNEADLLRLQGINSSQYALKVAEKHARRIENELAANPNGQ